MRHPLGSKGAALADFGVSMHTPLGGRPRRARIEAQTAIPFPAPGALLDLDFVRRLGYVYGFGASNVRDLLLPEAIGSGGTVFDQRGFLVDAAAPRLDADPSSYSSVGLLAEPQRTQAIRNSTMQGAVPGSPGTAPTAWAITTVAGVSASIVGTGTENGIEYIDVRWNGTAGATGGCNVYFETPTWITAASGQTWTLSTFLTLQGGALAGFNSANLIIEEITSGGAFVTNGVGGIPSINAGSLALSRPSFTRTLSGGGTVGATRPVFHLAISNGAAVDITVRIGLPVMEQGPFASSPTRSTNAQVTRVSDDLTFSGGRFTPWYNPDEGSIYSEYSSRAFQTSQWPGPFVLWDGTGNNCLHVFSSQTSGEIRAEIWSGGVLQFGPDVLRTGVAVNQSVKSLVSYRSNNRFVACAGGVIRAQSFGAMPSVSRLRIGSSRASTTNGPVRRVIYWPRQLSEDMHLELTR